LLPYSTCGIEGPPARGLPAFRVTPSGFGYPLDVFLPSNPCRFCFTPAALLGFTLRSVPLSKGIRKFPAGMTHVPLTTNQKAPESTSQLATPVSGLCSFRESLATTPVFSGPATGCSLGFSSSRGSRQASLAQDFAQAPLTCLAVVNGAYESLHLRVSISPLPGSPESKRQAATNRQTTLVEFLRLHTPGHSNKPTRWLWVHLTPRHALPQTGRRSLREGLLYRSCPAVP
jgi:hypothetical protein